MSVLFPLENPYQSGHWVTIPPFSSLLVLAFQVLKTTWLLLVLQIGLLQLLVSTPVPNMQLTHDCNVGISHFWKVVRVIEHPHTHSQTWRKGIWKRNMLSFCFSEHTFPDLQYVCILLLYSPLFLEYTSQLAVWIHYVWSMTFSSLSAGHGICLSACGEHCPETGVHRLVRHVLWSQADTKASSPEAVGVVSLDKELHWDLSLPQQNKPN